VGYLDMDVGQPEFAPPGCISFHVVDDAIEGQHVFAWGLVAAVL
jgi:polynucleotide 5'-kinase involved in rRNA processing